jgi:hypothetical protein
MPNDQEPTPPPYQPPQESRIPSYYAQPGQPPAPNPLDKLIPTKNTNALLAYYFGVFSLIPCFGLFLGVAAIVLGIQGKKAIVQNPDLPGKTHAGVGIWVGGFSVLAHAAFALLIAFAMAKQ